MAKSPEELAHQEWLGYVQPVGLVVSIPAMLDAACYVNKNIMTEHARFLSCLPRQKPDELLPEIRDLPEFTQKVLGWEAEDLNVVPQRVALTGDLASLEVILPQYHETLRPTHAVPVFRPAAGQKPWMVLIQELPSGANLDEPSEADTAKHWNAAPQAKFERLLREAGVPIGLLSNRRQLRLVYAPKGESSGHATFNVDEMMQVAGRPMFAALHMLLCAERMSSLADNQLLPAILENSRKYQNIVSTTLAEQVLAALYELMRGFQAANDVRRGELLREVLASDPSHVYSGLLTVLMRLVFVMYAEDRDLLSSDPIYSNYYSVTGLFNRLREDAGRHPDTMNQRYGAWSQLMTVFRLIYEGGQHGDFKLPARKGYLFDPDRYPFLEGRQRNADQNGPISPIPRVSDGVVYHVLRNLLILDGERLSYRTLDVEQIGSVYETVMGFNLQVAAGKSIAIKAVKSHGAPATINLEALLAAKGKDRAKWLKEQSDQTLGKDAAALLKDAKTVEQLLEALDKKIAKKVTPRTVPAGAIVLQPSDERRRSGSHYTPRSLTEPIVRTTLEPILKALADPAVELPAAYEPSREDKQRYTKGELEARIRQSEKAIDYAKLARQAGMPHPAQILDLKICDPAMGSGAFLVETCRQLGEELIKAWHAHNLVPTDIPPDEDEVLYARRLVAQRCLYGVDKNDMAVDLAKLSLWLVTLAKDHPFTFLDHSLRHGDSLVGLTRRQIIGFHWEPKKQRQFGEELIQKRLDRATAARAKILTAREDVPYRDQEERLALAEEALKVVRLTGDACVSAFFAGSKPKEREKRCEELFGHVSDWYASGLDPNKRGPMATAAASLRSGEHPLPPFHWEIEFPEVFSRDNGGFDGFVGNPPFAGKNTLINSNRIGYLDWLKLLHEGSHGNADLVAHFFRRAYDLVRAQGCFGLIATNTISQGDTRSTGLTQLRLNGGEIFAARKRYHWPGVAAVVVSVVHMCKGHVDQTPMLDARQIPKITAFLLHAGADDNPKPLSSNQAMSFIGSYVLGMGFTFDDTDSSGVATPLSVMYELVRSDNRNADRIFPYIGGEEINTSPTHAHHRYVINFENYPLRREQSETPWREMSERERRAVERTGIVPLDYPDPVASDWANLLEIVGSKVQGTRASHSTAQWWHFERARMELYRRVHGLSRVLCTAQTGNSQAFAFLPSRMVWTHTTVVFPTESFEFFASLQSRAHQEWARVFGATMKDDLRYLPSDCFENYPLPTFCDALRRAGETLYKSRAELMVHNDEGLTKTYNRFHDPHEKSPEIKKLRELHEAMDRAVLEAYGWRDLAQTARCEFLLDYEAEDDEPSSQTAPRGRGGKGKKKKPWRLRWPDDFRDEVLARLLELNEQRHQQELLAGGKTARAEKEAAEKTPKAPRPKKKAKSEQSDLFQQETYRQRRFVLMLLRAWDGRPLTRRALNAGMILLLDDKLRTALLKGSTRPARKRKVDLGLNHLYTELSIDGYIVIDNSGVQQVVRLTADAPTSNDAPQEDVDRIAAVQEFFRREAEAGKVTISEEEVDASFDFVPA